MVQHLSVDDSAMQTNLMLDLLPLPLHYLLYNLESPIFNVEECHVLTLNNKTEATDKL